MNKLNNKIFAVDDDLFHLGAMKQILNSNGDEEIVTFENGVECLLEIHQNPKIVFLDHQMGIYTGFETLKKIKRHNPNIFVVMVSAQEEMQTAIDALKYGAFDYLQKDENLEQKVLEVMQKINEVEQVLKKKKSFGLKSLLKIR
ncbi:response regulator [Brumimicrobium mesophilum]|uniref:response regulator n=1 Tax=Brumimicrobium mesophilum TaxID=392717 RepID=UPI001F481D34|nr:response regulator [Brumimicrobium mesophilum]